LVTTQNGALSIAGAAIRVTTIAGRDVRTVQTDDSGRFSIVLPAGEYRLRATRPQYRTRETLTVVTAGRRTTVLMDLDVAAADETVIVASGGDREPDRMATSQQPGFSAATAEQLPVGGRDAIAEVQRLAAGVIQTAGGVSIKGARANQSSMQLGRAYVPESSTGLAIFRLPWDAIRSIQILPNSYAVEFGRFSSGVTVVETKSGDARWRWRANNFIPSLRTRRGAPADILGIERFGPQLSLQGPVIRDRLFLAESVEYRYESVDLRSRAQTDVTTSRAFNSFTRLDLRGGAHTVSLSANVLPQQTTAFNLDTFTPPDTAARLRQNLVNIIATDAATLSASTLIETLVHVSWFNAHVGPSGAAADGMELGAMTNRGRYFTDQRRDVRSLQWAETWSRAVERPGNQHLITAGTDLLRAAYDGSRTSAPVSVTRADGTLSRRLTFRGASVQHVVATDAAAFLQDRWRAGTRWVIDAGVRIDRDGVFGHVNRTVRAGFSTSLGDTGKAVLRGGAGLFYERTPSMVGAFGQFEDVTETRFGADGVTDVVATRTASPLPASGLATPRSVIWSAGFTQQLNRRLSVRANVLVRKGTGEAIVQSNAAGTALTLASGGRSEYREGEIALRYLSGKVIDADASYTRSTARADLNAFSAFYGNVPWPIIGQNAHAVANADVPHRLIARVRVTPGDHWLVAAIVECRSGLPYGALNEFHEPVLPRNAYRMPSARTVDVNIERRFRIGGRRPWIGVRIFNAFDAVNPSDVQRRLDAPNFGATFNSRPRQIRLQLRFE
jgi:hypothetical protein